MNLQVKFLCLNAASLAVAMLLLLPGGVVFGQPATAPAATSIEAREKEACTKNLRQIYEALQAYRRDHKDLPNWLSDLVPKYLADPSVLVCPITRRTGRDNPFRHLADPKMATSYMYEFCDGETGTIWQGGKMKMRQFKGLQMALVGGGTPILRCHLHNPVLNIGFDGRFYDSGEMWEDRFLDMVNMADLSPSSLLARFTDSSAQTPSRPTVTTAGSSRRPLPAYAALLGKPAPNFKLDLLEGGEFELAAFKDKKIVILDFWATWCGPCRSALPILAQVAEQYKSKDVILRAVDLREQPEKIRAYLKTTDFPLTVLLDKDGSIAKLYGVSGIPQTVIVGKDGIVQTVHVGYSPEVKRTLQQNLDTLLAGGSLFTSDLDYIKSLIQQHTPQSLSEAEKLAAGKPELLQLIAEARARSDQGISLLDLEAQARTLYDAGNFAEAEGLFRQALELRRKLPESDNSGLAACLQNFATALFEQQKLSEAESLYRELLELKTTSPAARGPSVDIVLSELGTTLCAQNKFDQAEPFYRRCLAIREENTPDVWYTFYTRSVLGGTLLEQKKYSEAEPFLVSGYEGLKQREKTFANRNQLLKEALNRLVRLYQATNRPDQAAQWKQKLAEFEQAAK